MVTVGYLLRCEAQAGKEAHVERSLQEALAAVQEEPRTTAGFGFRMGPSTYGLFVVFPGEEDLQTLAWNKVLAQMDTANSILTQPHITKKVDVLAAKLPKKKGDTLVTVGQLICYEAKPGNEAGVERIIKESLPIIEQEPGTTAWFGFHLGSSTFGSFDAFPDEEARLAHLSAGMERVREGALDLIIEGTLVIEKTELFATRL